MSAARLNYRREVPPEVDMAVVIVSAIEIALLALAGILTWRANRGISRMQHGAARVAVRVGANFVAVVVILVLLLFLTFQSSG